MYIHGRIVADRLVSIIRTACMVCIVAPTVYEGAVFVARKYVRITYGHYKIKPKNLITDYTIKTKLILRNYNKIKKTYSMATQYNKTYCIERQQ